jgi:hypothetical protein
MGNKSNLQRDTEFSFNQIEEEVRKISQIGQAIKNSRLKQKTIVLLLQDMTKIKKSDIELILDKLPELEKEYLKK